jgi:AGCS family alanine or glycine:cation symporter
MGQKWYAIMFAIALIFALGFAGQMVQANGISNALVVAFGSGETVVTSFGEVGITKIVAGIAVSVLIGFVIFGGVKRIAHFSQIVVPCMAIAYIATALAICILNIDQLPGVITMIFKDAFTPMAGAGAAIGWGVRRGIYSSEAGEGTGTHAAAAAEVEHPAQQGLVQAFSVYVDTLFVCSATAFVILTTGAYNVYGAEVDFLIQNLPHTVDPNGPAFTQYALDSVMPGVGSKFVAVVVFFFASTTLLASYYCAETNIAYLMRTFRIPKAILIFKFLTMSVILFGAINPPRLAWAFSDFAVGVNMWMNLIALLIIFFFMGNPAIKVLKDYEAQQKSGVETFTFDPKALGIENAKFWEKDER